MSKEINIYNYNEPKKRSHSYLSGKQLLIICIVVLLSPLPPFFVCKQCSGASEAPVAKAKEQPVKVVERVKESVQPIEQPTTFVNASGATETTVTMTVITSPYTWQYELTDVTTNDDINVNIKLSITSQIKAGMEKMLVQNYGGNWFYAVFATPFSDVAKADIKGHYSGIDLKMKMRGVEQQLTIIAQKVVQQLSETSLLPVEIKDVKIAEVKL